MGKLMVPLALTAAVGLMILVGGGPATANHAPGTIVFVGDSTPGDDGDGCGAEPVVDPCDTIQTGINHATSGLDTVQVAAGTYPENLNLAKDLTLRGAQAGNDACGRTASESIVTGSGLLLELDTGSANATIDGFTFSGGARAIESDTGPITNLQILNNRIRGFTDVGVFLNDSGINITADQNEVDGSAKTGLPIGGALFHLDGSDNFDGFHFTNNCVINGTAGTSAGTGFFSGSTMANPRSVDAGGPPTVSAGARVPMFTGNLIDNNLTGANLSHAWGDGPISDNTFSDNDFDGLQGGPRNALIERNTFAGNGRNGLALTSFGNTTDANRGAQNSRVLTNCVTGNGFVQAGAGIFFSNTQFPGTIGTNEAHNNSITGNAMGARYPAPGTELINATLNWWGASNGPGPPDGTGSGDGVDGHGQILFTPFLLTPAPAVPAACPVLPQPPLDHFKCYVVPQDDDDDDNGSGNRRRVTLEDQFGSGEAYVDDKASDLCNPADKNGEGMNQPEAHLVSYGIEPINRRFEQRRVETDNQFGTLTLEVQRPQTLLVPSSKAHPPEEPGEPPRLLDHFQCYKVLEASQFQSRYVRVKDQFQDENVRVLRPSELCNPVNKNGEGIRSVEEHLVCYSIMGGKFQRRTVVVRNQFGTESLRVVKQKSLCVPSQKRDLGPVCPPNDDDDDDGLTNNNEKLLFTLLSYPDSDHDGIEDGNDDANGNGEDDEDEDDDDECPDEDSDGDGTDDEDEDD